MKNKFYYFYSNLKLYVQGNIFKTILSLLISLVFFSCLGIGYPYIFTHDILKIFTDIIFCLFTFLILFLNSLNTYLIFQKNDYFILRFKSKKRFFSEFLKQVFINNLLILLLEIILVFIGCILLLFVAYKSQTIDLFYNISMSLYLPFFLFRNIILYLLISLIFSCSFFLLNPTYTTVLFSVFIAYFFTDNYIFSTSQLSRFSVSFSLSSYFDLFQYSTFINEVFSSCLMVVILGFILILLFKSLRYSKDIGY